MYYAVKSGTANRLKFAVSYANAVAGTPTVVPIAGVGSGDSHDLTALELTSIFYDCEAVLQPIGVTTSSISFNPIVPGAETDITVGFTFDYALTTADVVVITCKYSILAWEQVSYTNMTLTGADAASFSGILDIATNKISLTPRATLAANTAYTVVLGKARNHIKVPVEGVYDDPASFRINVETASRYYAHGPFDFSSSTVISSVLQTEVTSYRRSKGPQELDATAVGLNIDRVNLGFELSNTALTANSDVTFKFPGFSFSGNVNGLTCITTSSANNYPFTAYWNVATSEIRLRSTGVVPFGAGKITLQVDFPIPGLLPPATGMVTNSPSLTVALTMSGSTYPDLAATPVLSSPCIGICSVAVSYDVGAAGMVAQFNIAVTTSNPLTPGDELNMNMTRIMQGALDKTLSLGGADGASFTGTYSGTASRSNDVSDTGNGVLVLKCSQTLSSSSFVVSVDRTNGLTLPFHGIPSGKTFNVNATPASTNATTIGPVADTSVPTSGERAHFKRGTLTFLVANTAVAFSPCRSLTRGLRRFFNSHVRHRHRRYHHRQGPHHEGQHAEPYQPRLRSLLGCRALG